MEVDEDDERGRSQGGAAARMRSKSAPSSSSAVPSSPNGRYRTRAAAAAEDTSQASVSSTLSQAGESKGELKDDIGDKDDSSGGDGGTRMDLDADEKKEGW